MLKKTIRSFLRKIWRRIKKIKAKRDLIKVLVDRPTVSYPDFLTASVNHIKSLQFVNDFSLVHSGGEWICNIGGLQFSLNSAEEILIIKEIFVDGIYNVETSQPFTFIDIGMNVGITSLFFAKKAECKQVVAFEPFQPTLAFAKINMKKNEVANKIYIHEVGLGYPPRTLTINYSEEFKGSVGIHGVASYIGEKKDIKEVSLPVMDVFEALKDIMDEKIIVKIDCEGSEYEILERLNDTGLLSRFSIIMIEWHNKGPASLQKFLIDKNFEVLSMGAHNKNIGMMYGFKK